MIFRRVLAALPLLTLALTGCGGHDAAPVAQLRAPSGAPSADPASTGAGAVTPDGQPASGQPAGSRPVSTSPAVPAWATAAASQPTAAGQQGAAGQPAGTSTATQPGTYTFDTTGTVTALGSARDAAGVSTLAVDPAIGQTQHSVLSDSHGKTIQDVVVRPDGSYLSRLEISNAGFDKTFAPSPAVLLLPAPTTPGSTWSWTALSTDGKTQLTSKNTVLRTETLTIGGEKISTSVIRTELTLRGADVTYDGTQDTWFALGQRLPVKLHSTGNGNARGVAFSTDTTSTARSSHPS